MTSAMREPTYFILLALAGDARHGYAITSAARDLSDGRVRLAAGTLYGALERLTSSGLVAVDGEEVVDGRLRRYYRLTDQGKDALDEEIERLRSSVKAAESHGRLRPAPKVAGADA